MWWLYCLGSYQNTAFTSWSRMATPAPTITSALQWEGKGEREKRSSWPLSSGILTRNYKHRFCLMTLSQNLATGICELQKDWLWTQLKCRSFITQENGENGYWGTLSSLCHFQDTFTFSSRETALYLFSALITVVWKPLDWKDLLATLQSQGFARHHITIYSTFSLLMLPFPILSWCSYLICHFHCRA